LVRAREHVNPSRAGELRTCDHVQDPANVCVCRVYLQYPERGLRIEPRRFDVCPTNSRVPFYSFTRSGELHGKKITKQIVCIVRAPWVNCTNEEDT
jgi:hypothetical protein